MSEAIVVAIITGAAAIISNLIISNRTSKDNEIKQAVFHEEVCNRLSNLEKENQEIKTDLKEHNGYAQKFVEMHDDILGIRQEVALITQDNKHIKEKIKEYHG